jgi:Domain of unknown function (DUF1707)
VVAGPGDEMDAWAAGRGRMRASHADREQAIDVLKAAFVQDRLTRDELDTRAGQALTARTRADLAALTADIPPAPAAARPERPLAPGRRRPLARAAAKSGGCLVIAVAAVRVVPIADPGNSPGAIPGFWAPVCLLVALVAVVAALIILVLGVEASLAQRRSRRQLPPRPGSGGQALDAEQHGGTGQVGHDPALPRDRPDQARADLRSDGSRPDRPHSSGRGNRAPRGIRPVPDAV